LKAILEFTLPEEQHEYKEAMNGGRYLALIHDIRDKIRSVKKYGPDMTFDEFVEFLKNETDFYELTD